MGVITKLMELYNRQDAGHRFVVQENADGTISYGLTDQYGTAPIGSIPNEALGRELAATGVPIKTLRKQFFPLGNFDVSSSGAITRVGVYRLPFAWKAFRLRAFNGITSATIPNHLVAAGSLPDATGFNDLVNNPLVTATFSGTAAHEVPIATVSDTSFVIPGQITSDVMYSPSVALSDGSAGSIVRVVNTIPSGAPASNSRMTAGSSGVNFSFSASGLYGSYQTGVDGITTPASYASATDANTTLPPVQFIGYTTDQVFAAGVVGSSTSGGSGDTGVNGGWPVRAKILCNTEDAVKVLAISTIAASSAKSVTILQQVDALLAQPGLDALVYTPYAANDGNLDLQATIDAMIGKMYHVIDTCRLAGVIPVLMTYQATSAISGTAHTLRQQCNATVRAVASLLGLPVIDVELNLSSMGSTPAWLDDADTNGGQHLSSQGHQKVAVLAKEAFGL